MRYTFLDRRGDTVYFIGHKLEIYIPRSFFDDEIAEEYGMEILSMGTFPMYLYTSDTSKPELYQFSLPEMITFSFSESREEKSVIKGIEDIYRIFTLYKEDIFMKSVKLTKNAKNTETFSKLHQKAKIPQSVNYEDIIKMYFENMMTNDADLHMPSNLLEMMIAETARSKENVNIPFRKLIGANAKVSQLDYVLVSIKQLAMINSTFTAITSEDINQALQAAISKSRTQGLELETPIEKTIKY